MKGSRHELRAIATWFGVFAQIIVDLEVPDARRERRQIGVGRVWADALRQLLDESRVREELAGGFHEVLR